MKKIILALPSAAVLFFCFTGFQSETSNKISLEKDIQLIPIELNQDVSTSKISQLRIFTINKGEMNKFLDAWRKGVYPLRIKNGFKIEGAWTVQGKNKFFWILSYDGPEGFTAKDSAYYASESRKKLDPDPVQYIAESEKYFIESALP